MAEPGSRTKLSKRKLAQYLKNADFKQMLGARQKIAERIGLAAEADTFNPVIVDFYREVGYLPWAIDNYLALLGWSYDDKTEFFSRDELVRQFTLERINSSPASFDPEEALGRAGPLHARALDRREARAHAPVSRQGGARRRSAAGRAPWRRCGR